MTGGTEIIVIVAVVLVLFGASAIPKFARSLGRARKEFEEGVKEGAADKDEEKSDAPDACPGSERSERPAPAAESVAEEPASGDAGADSGR